MLNDNDLMNVIVYWFLGSLKVSGGASVSILIVKGSADIFIELDGLISIVDVDGMFMLFLYIS
jgi:hypothetical protein